MVRKPHWSEEDKELLRQNFPTASTKSLCELFLGRPYHGIRHVARRMGLEKDPIYHVNRKHPPKPQFWQEWSPELAYVLGLILTDGSIRNERDASVKIRLRLRDKEVLQSLVPIAGGYFRESPKEAMWACSGRDVVEWIAEKGIRENKLFRATLPDCSPELKSHLFRGLFDGDGHFSCLQRQGKRIRRAGMCGQPVVLESMLEVLEDIIGYKPRISGDARCQCSAFVICQQEAVRKVVDWLYADATLFIPAKREQAQKAACV